MTLQLGTAWHHVETIDSTNAHLKRLAAEGAPMGTVVSAEMQTAGYGQRGRAWVSAAAKGLYVSVLLPFPSNPYPLPFVLGLGCRDGLAAWTDAVGLKWVNDLVARRKKLGGMLVELTKHGAIAGIGINLAPQDVPDAISLRELTGADLTAREVLERVLPAIAGRWAQWEREGFDPVRADWQAASVTLGRDVHVVGEGEPLVGRAEAIGPLGELMLRRPNGALTPVISGSVRLADGAYC